LGSADFDPGSTDTAGRLNDDVRTKHRCDAERIDRADGVKLAAAKLDAVLCLIAGKRVSISDDIGRRAAAQEIICL
jgi:hypothetical protein